MAVIEEEPSVKEDFRSQPRTANAAAPSGYTSDGYETASDSELNDTVSEPGTHSRNNGDSLDNQNSNGDVGSEVKQEKQQEQIVPIEEEDVEKALAQVNDEKIKGNSLFKDGLYEDALMKYEFAIQVAPDGPSSSEIRSICHSNRATCFFKLAKYEETVKECTKALELNPTYIKALLRRAEAREKLELYEESIADMSKILELDPCNDQARRTMIRLKPLADEKREKMKEEMIGKLKDMGNSILGRFGMGIDNFKAVKDPHTGSYSISFQQ